MESSLYGEGVGASQVMGPSLLSQQPVTPRKDPKQSTKEWNIVYSKLQGRLGGLKNWRYSWWLHWGVLAQYFSPRRYQWLITPNRQWRGSPINNQIIDSTGLQAVRTCAAGMWTGLTSPSRPWFAIEMAGLQDEIDAEGQTWIEESEETLYAVLAGSNFYNTMAQAFEDVTVFGTAPVVIYEDFTDVIRCYLRAPGEYYLGTNSRLSIDTLYGEFVYTVAQIVGRWDVSNCPQVVVNLWVQGGGSLDVEFVIAHSIEPNFGFDAQNGKDEIKLVPEEFTFREVYWLRDQKAEKPLEVNGFRSTPFMAARWATVSNDAYGRSPCMDALGDNIQVQVETLRKAEFIEKGVRPPMGASPELKNEPASIVPGNITYVTNDGQKKGFWPLFQPEAVWLSGITADIDRVNARIQSCLFVDLFMAITKMEGVQPRNELELTQRNQERLQELGPFVHMFENEFAAPALRRIIDICMRKGVLRPLPESLRGKSFKITFLSIMRQAQRAMEAVSMKDVLQFGGVASAAAKNAGLPDPLRQLNLDKYMREYTRITGLDQDLLFTLDEVAENDAARAKGEQQAMAPDQISAMAQTAKVMSDTPLDGGTMLGSLLGRAPA